MYCNIYIAFCKVFFAFCKIKNAGQFPGLHNTTNTALILRCCIPMAGISYISLILPDLIKINKRTHIIKPQAIGNIQGLILSTNTPPIMAPTGVKTRVNVLSIPVILPRLSSGISFWITILIGIFLTVPFTTTCHYLPVINIKHLQDSSLHTPYREYTHSILPFPGVIRYINFHRTDSFAKSAIKTLVLIMFYP